MRIPEFYSKIYKEYRKNLLNAIKSKCNVCSGKGYELLEDNMFKDCVCIKQYNILKKYADCGINVKHIKRDDDWFKKEFTDKTFEKLMQMKDNLDDILKINFVIYPTKTDKWGASHIGNQIIKYCVDDDKTCAVVSSKSVMDMLFSWDNIDFKECLEYLSWVDVLLIDELGVEYNSKMKENNSFITNAFSGFIMNRKHTNKTTIITSNMTLPTLKNIYSADLYNIISDNFVGVSVDSKTKKKSEFEGLENKLKNTKIISCFDEIDVETPKDKKTMKITRRRRT